MCVDRSVVRASTTFTAMIGARYFFGPVGFVRSEQAGVDRRFRAGWPGDSGSSASRRPWRRAPRRSGQMAAGDLPRATSTLGGVAGANGASWRSRRWAPPCRVGGVVTYTWQVAVEVLDDRHPASREMRSISPLPPRGTITSTNSGMAISSPTAARSVVSMTCTAAGRQAGDLQPGMHAGGDRLVAVQGPPCRRGRIAALPT